MSSVIIVLYHFSVGSFSVWSGIANSLRGGVFCVLILIKITGELYEVLTVRERLSPWFWVNCFGVVVSVPATLTLANKDDSY